MDFRILGALEVWDGEDRVTISGRLHPKILSGLLLNTGRTVSISWLVDALWDNNPPTTARRQVQNTVAALRRQLASVRDDLFERIGQDYRINIAEDELDLRRFGTAAREARRLAGEGRPGEALARFEDGLNLWRGPALHNLKGRTLEAAAARLNDMYLSTYEEYAEASLSVGEPERVTARLQEFVAEHPLRQRLAARLMHALYQSNRAPEALRVFEDIRAALAAELGLDPGSELKDLRVRILQDDRALTPHQDQPSMSLVHTDELNPIGNESPRSTPATSILRPVPLAPAQLPTDVATFTGRDEHLAALDQLRDSGVRAGIVSAITGMGGVGKTALAVHWGHTRREDFPDGQLYINLRGFDEREPLTPYEAVSRLMRTLGYSAANIPTDLDEAAALYRSLLADKRMLVLLDNAKTTEQVRPLLPGSPGTLALVTSRNTLPSLTVTHDARQVKLNTLTPDESLGLLANLIGPEASADIATTKRVCVLCGHLPLALRIVAANLVQNPHRSLAQLVDRLTGDARLSHLNVDSDTAADLQAVFDLSYRTLSEGAQRLFLYLGLIPGDDFTSSLAASMTETPIKSVQATLQELVAAHLLDQYQPGRFRFHDLIRLYVRKLASERIGERDRSRANGLLIDWYGDWSNSDAEEFNNCIAACDAFRSHPNLWKLIRSLGPFVDTGNDLGAIRERVDSAIQTFDANGNTEARIYALNVLSAIYNAYGDKEKALETCRHCESLLIHVTDIELHGRIFGNFGSKLLAVSAYTEAESYLRRSLRIAESTGDSQSIMTTAGNLGRVLAATGRYTECETYFQLAEDTAREKERPYFVASIVSSRAQIYADTGRLEAAESAARQAIEISREIGSSRIMALALRHMGVIAQIRGQHQEALEILGNSLDLARKNQRVNTQNAASQILAETHLKLGNFDQALKFLSSGTELLKGHMPSGVELGEHARILCRILSATNEHARAIEQGEQACDIYRNRSQNHLLLARSLDALGEAHQGNNDPASARDCWTEALAIFTDLDVPEARELRAKLAAHMLSLRFNVQRQVTAPVTIISTALLISVLLKPGGR